MKGTDKKISMITAYDYTMAKIVDESGVNTILVGDSLGNTILGYEDTISVTVDDMIHHSAAVARGAKNRSCYHRYAIYVLSDKRV